MTMTKFKSNIQRAYKEIRQAIKDEGVPYDLRIMAEGVKEELGQLCQEVTEREQESEQ